MCIRDRLHLSREKAAQAVRSGAVSLNGAPEQEVSHMLCEGDVLSVRGYGKMCIRDSRTPAPSLAELIEMLRQDGDADHCPHGRPVSVRMRRHEIEKKFGRLG